MTTGNTQRTQPNLQVPPPSLDEPPPPPVPPPPPPPRKKPLNCVQCACLLKDSPARRSGPQGPGTLCNACGLRILKRKRAERGIGKNSRKGRPKRNTQAKRHPSSHSKTPADVPLYSTVPQSHIAGPSTAPIAAPARPANPVDPSLFAPLPPNQSQTTSPQAHTTASVHRRPVPAASAPRDATPVASVPCSSPAPTTVNVIHPAAMPSPINPNQNAILRSSSLPAQSPAPVADQKPAAPVRQTRSIPPAASNPMQLHIPPAAPPKNPPMLQPETPQHPMSTLPQQYSDADESSAEQMFSALEIGASPLETATQGSGQTVDHSNFPDDVFGRCDSAETNSTHLDLVEVLEAMPPDEEIVPAEGPYEEHGNVAPMAMAMSSMPMATPPVSMAPAPFSGIMPGQTRTPMSAVVVQPNDITECMRSLTTLDQVNSQISQSVSSMDERIAALARKHQQLTLERNDVSMSLTQLVNEKNVAAKEQRQVCDFIARTTCLLHYLQKQETFSTGT